MNWPKNGNRRFLYILKGQIKKYSCQKPNAVFEYKLVQMFQGWISTIVVRIIFIHTHKNDFQGCGFFPHAYMEELTISSCQKLLGKFENNFHKKFRVNFYQECSSCIYLLKNMDIRGCSQYFICIYRERVKIVLSETIGLFRKQLAQNCPRVTLYQDWLNLFSHWKTWSLDVDQIWFHFGLNGNFNWGSTYFYFYMT